MNCVQLFLYFVSLVVSVILVFLVIVVSFFLVVSFVFILVILVILVFIILVLFILCIDISIVFNLDWQALLASKRANVFAQEKKTKALAHIEQDVIRAQYEVVRRDGQS